MNEDEFEVPLKYLKPYWGAAVFLLLIVMYAKSSSFSKANLIYIVLYFIGAKAIGAFLFKNTMLLPGGFFEPHSGYEIRIFMLLVGAIPIVLFSLFMV